jgi:hypothetical protein
LGNNKKDTAQQDYVTQSQFEALLESLSIIDTLQAKLESMEQLLKTSNAKVLSLETEVATNDKIILGLRGKANSLEQYNRKWSIRINNLPLPHADETETKDVMQTVYDKVLLPIFQGAVSSGLLNTIPDCNSVLETAHILPAKSNDRPKTIIARFYSRNVRALVFRLKREYAPTKTVTTSSSTNNRRGRPPRRSTATQSMRTSRERPSTSCRPCLRTPGRDQSGPSAATSGSNCKVKTLSERSSLSMIQLIKY